MKPILILLLLAVVGCGKPEVRDVVITYHNGDVDTVLNVKQYWNDIGLNYFIDVCGNKIPINEDYVRKMIDINKRRVECEVGR